MSHCGALNRFGFHNGSSIDSLLDKGDVSVEAILDEDDLLQECKAQNTRLIDYFGRDNVLQTLLGYVIGEVEIEEKGFKCAHLTKTTNPIGFLLRLKVSLYCNRGLMQRDMVHCRDLRRQAGPTPIALLGDRPR